MKKIYILLLSFWAMSAGMAAAQDASIRGKVTDKTTGRNMAGAKVQLLLDGKVKKEVTTDAGGNYILDSLPYGTYDVECRNPAYTPQRMVGLQLKRSSLRLVFFKMTYNPALLTKVEPKKGRKTAEEIEIHYTHASLQAKQNAETKIATTTEEKQLDVPNTGYIITQDEIRGRGYQYLLDVLEDLPEFEIQEKVTPEHVNIIASRGIAGSGRWLIMQDGIRINSMVGSDVVIAQNILVATAQRIEVIVGPSSAIYGADAFSGVINIVTQDGAQINGGEVQASYGTYNTTANHLNIGYGKKDWSIAGFGHIYRSAEAYMPRLYPNEFGWYEEQYLQNSGMMESPFSDDTVYLQRERERFDISTLGYSAGVRARYKDFEIGAMRNGEWHSSAMGYNYRYALPTQGSRYGTSLNNVYARHSWEGEKWSTQTSLQWNYWEIDPNSRFTNVYSGYQEAYKFGYETFFQGRASAGWKIHKNHHLSFGLSLMSGHSLARTSDLMYPWLRGWTIEEQEQYYIGSDTFNSEGDSLHILQRAFYEYRTTYGLFAQYQIKIKDKLTITAGGRLDYIQTDLPTPLADGFLQYFYFLPAPRIGLVYKPTKELRLRLSYSTGILTPPFQKTHTHYGSFTPRVDGLGNVIGLQAGYWRLPTPNDDELQFAEFSRCFEFSTSYSKNDFFFAANGYYNLLDNLFQNEIRTNMPFVEGDSSLLVPVAEIATSTAFGHVFGAMARVDYRMFLNKTNDMQLRMSLSYAFVSGWIGDQIEQQPDKLPFYNAPHTVKAGVFFDYKGFSSDLRFIYRTRTVNEGFGTGTGFAQYGNQPFLLVNLFAQYRAFTSKDEKLQLNAFLRIRNLLNNRYYHTGTPNAAQLSAVPQDPIRISVGVNFRFK